MRQTLYILTLTIGVLSCNSKTERTVNQITSDSLEISSIRQRKSSIYIKDQSKYSQTFIEELTAMNYNKPIKLIDDFVVVGTDTTQFPADLELNKKTVFKGTGNNKFYELILIRTSLTEIVFTFFIRENNEEIVLPTKEGIATLNTMFFLDSEVDEDSQTSDGYGSCEYWNKANDCCFSIRVGIGRDDNEKQRAMLNYICNDKSKEMLNLDKCPTLRTE
jgi:hypothetical protein